MRDGSVERAQKRADLGGEPVIEAYFVNSVKVKLHQNGGAGTNEHIFLDANSQKYKGHVEMLLTDKGIRIRSVDHPEQVRTVPFANITSYVALADVAWSQDRYDAEQEAKAEEKAKLAAQAEQPAA